MSPTSTRGVRPAGIVIASTAGGAGDTRRECPDPGHRHQERDACDAIVGVEGARVPGETPPRPPHRHEEPGEHRQPLQRVILVQLSRERRHGGNEDEVEKQLEPACLPFLEVSPRRHGILTNRGKQRRLGLRFGQREQIHAKSSRLL